MALHYVNWVTSLDLQWKFENDKVILSVSNNYAKDKIETFECRWAECE